MSLATWTDITFEEHFDKNTLEFVFPDGSRQKVYSRLMTHSTNDTTSWNPEIIPASLKQTVFDYLIHK